MIDSHATCLLEDDLPPHLYSCPLLLQALNIGIWGPHCVPRHYCRFCNNNLADWKTSLTPEALKPEVQKVQPIMVVYFEGEIHRCVRHDVSIRYVYIGYTAVDGGPVD